MRLSLAAAAQVDQASPPPRIVYAGYHSWLCWHLVVPECSPSQGKDDGAAGGPAAGGTCLLFLRSHPLPSPDLHLQLAAPLEQELGAGWLGALGVGRPRSRARAIAAARRWLRMAALW